jgi:D-alanyl-D-alanine-carboxypeptidase/D-alanyl-D-alanine-endopeptidase
LRLDRRRAAAIAGLLLALAACKPPPAPPAPAAIPAADFNAPLSPPAQALLGDVFAQSQAQGMVVAVVRGDAMTTTGFGRISRANPQAPDGRVLVRLQSISKLFASDLLSAFVAEGRLKLSDPLASYAPAGWAPSKATKALSITLLSLATHTSGLPRGPYYDPAVPVSVADAARWDLVARQQGLSAPGRGAHYSNLGFDLLGDALASAAHSTYEAALAGEITGPLGMADTTATPTPAQCARMMAGDVRRQLHPCVDQTGEAASGGLYSTADDMALWLRAQLKPDAAGDRRRISQQVYVRRDALAYAAGLDHAGHATGIGLAWIEQDASPGRPRILEKTGGGDGFLTYVVIDPVRRAGVFVGFNNVSGHRLGAVAAAADDLVILLGTEPDAIAIPGAAPAH